MTLQEQQKLFCNELATSLHVSFSNSYMYQLSTRKKSHSVWNFLEINRMKLAMTYSLLKNTKFLKDLWFKTVQEYKERFSFYMNVSWQWMKKPITNVEWYFLKFCQFFDWKIFKIQIHIHANISSASLNLDSRPKKEKNNKTKENFY